MGRHAHEDGALRKPIERRIDVEATQEGDGNRGQQRAVQCHEEAVDVEDRQAGATTVLRVRLPPPSGSSVSQVGSSAIDGSTTMIEGSASSMK